jgi:hypothetical protein
LEASDLNEMGPIDYLVVEWPKGTQPTGEAAPHLVNLVESGIIRILDLMFVAKGEDGTVSKLEIADLGDGLEIFEGASSGILGDDDLNETGNVLEPGATAALLVYENVWAGPFAAALRSTGAQLVANGRIPVQSLIAALDAAEAAA